MASVCAFSFLSIVLHVFVLCLFCPLCCLCLSFDFSVHYVACVCPFSFLSIMLKDKGQAQAIQYTKKHKGKAQVIQCAKKVKDKHRQYNVQKR
jgi:hypothetical protein